MPDTPKAVKCVIVDDKFVYGLHEGEDGTPAVAVPVSVYNRVRSWLITDAGYCEHEGMGGSAQLARELLDLLPEVPTHAE